MNPNSPFYANPHAAQGLYVEELSVWYGPIPAVHQVSLQVLPGEIVALVGANGAGKSSILKALVGMVSSHAKRKDADAVSLQRLAPNEILHKGVSLCPEGRRLLTTLTVQENLDLAGRWGLTQRNKGNSDHRPTSPQERLENAFQWFPKLKERRNQMAGTLSGGEAQMLAIARCLMCNPRYLLLDEPSLGLAPLVVEQVIQVVASLGKAGLGILWVEQNAHLALPLAHRAYVLETGRIVQEGKGSDVLHDPALQKAYFGTP